MKELMIEVERIVRPLHATTLRKRKFREELLAHLTAIYQDELSRSADPDTALNESIKRFGDPGELTHALEESLPWHERISYRLDRWMGWRAPESMTRYSFRLAIQSLAINLAVCVMLAILIGQRAGWQRGGWAGLVQPVAMFLIMPLDQFFLIMFYYKIRDAMHGAFGARQSRWNVAAFSLVNVLVVWISGMALTVFSESGKNHLGQSSMIYFAVGAAISAALGITAYRQGPSEISDTIWATLDVNGAGA